MSQNNGFLKVQREDNTVIDCASRLSSFEEFHIPLNAEERRKQASRCMHCGVPFCQSALHLKGMVTGCPLHNLIPEWNEELFQGNDQYALARLLKTNPFPEFTSRVCPALCEKACINGLDGEPTTVHDNENYIIENGFAQGWMTPRIPLERSGRTVAIIGSGPTGLSAAQFLNQRGHLVTVYEQDDHPGGLLMYGIPNMKLDKSIVKRRIELMKQEGIQFVCNTQAGKDITPAQLEENYDAIILAAGSRKPRSLNIETEGISGILYAVDYLSMNTRALLSGKKPTVSARGKHVVIVGGGDTGNDCVGTALRQQARSVIQLEMMPEPPETRRADNPWPEWPKVKKTDYGQQEAIFLTGKDPRIFSTTLIGIEEKNGRIKAVHTIQLGPDMKPIEGTESTLPCELLLIAAGFVGISQELRDDFQLQVTNRNVIETRDDSKALPKEKFFACGDCRRGQSLVVWALSEGKDCAREVDEYLMGYSNIE